MMDVKSNLALSQSGHAVAVRTHCEELNPVQPERLTIFLINQISSRGHLDMYARLYSRALLRLGYNVVLIAQREAGVPEWIEQQYRGPAEFRCYSRPEPAPVPPNVESAEFVSNQEPLVHKPLPLLRRVAKVWREESLFGIADRSCVYAWRFAVKCLHCVYWRYFRAAIAFVTAALEPAARAVQARSNGLVGWCIVRVATLLRRAGPGVSLGPWIDDVNTASAQFGRSPALLFFLYLDFVSESDANRKILSCLGVPWAGILFHPRCLNGPNRRKGERYFSATNCAGAAFLNPRAVAHYNKMYPGRAFVPLPDVTDAEFAEHEPALVKDIRARANGRTVVLAIGSIAPHKGVVELLDVIAKADPSRFFFVMAGEIFWHSFGEAETKLRAFCASPPENCLVHTQYIENERELNAIIAAADVVYAVYRDFKDSSNSLTKASIFRKPLLVSDGFLMGERVRLYRLGAAVRFGNVASILAGLNEVCARSPAEFGFEAYREAHSHAALERQLAACMKAWLEVYPARAADRELESPR